MVVKWPFQKVVSFLTEQTLVENHMTIKPKSKSPIKFTCKIPNCFVLKTIEKFTRQWVS